MRSSGILFIVSGPAGVGKTTVVNALLEHIPSTELQRAVTTTTRQPRPDEVHGAHYFFISEQEFQKKIQANDFFEYALVHGNTYYGSPRAEIYAKLSQGINLILVIDVQGYMNILKSFRDFRMVSIFIKPPTIDTLYTRLVNRGTETMPEIKNRLHTAENELLFADKYDYIINSGTRGHDFEEFLEIYNNETRA